jgi:MoxR-like ATPase
MTESSSNPFVGIEADTPLTLESDDRFGDAGHLWSQPEIDALTLAYAAQRPLLVRGEAGSGKSQLARAAAHALGHRSPLVEVIHPRFEALDLLYRLDAVERLADAQLGEGIDQTSEKYVKRGALWQAMDRCGKGRLPPVLLIDEIDKADADLPNALLEVLGNRTFAIPTLGKTISANGGRPPLIIITTNEERELPAAFVRRCVVLNLNPPDDDVAFVKWLVARSQVHMNLAVADRPRLHAAEQVLSDRRASVAAGYPKVGLAEFIDLLMALTDLTIGLPEDEREAAQLDWCQQLSAYALVKNAGQSQERKPRELPALAP